MIFYFTGTGNSLWVAEQIQKEFGGRCINIAGAESEYTLGKHEILGFVFPVYYWGVPDLVRSFFINLRIKEARPERTFIAVTCGGLTGTAIEQAETLLDSSGIAVGYKAAFSLPDNYAPLYKMPSRKIALQKVAEARPFLSDFIQKMKLQQQGDYNKSKGPLPAILSPVMMLTFPKGTRKFKADSSCTGCGLCSRICPANAIEMHDKKPVWVKPSCEKCLGCLHRCPVQSINYGKSSERHGRYLNPEITF